MTSVLIQKFIYLQSKPRGRLVGQVHGVEHDDHFDRRIHLRSNDPVRAPKSENLARLILV